MISFNRRVDIKAILTDPKLRQKLIMGVVRFCCALEGMNHGNTCVCRDPSRSRQMEVFVSKLVGCKGITAKLTRCRRRTAGRYCWQHEREAGIVQIARRDCIEGRSK